MVFLLLAGACVARAQEWNTPRARTVAEQAVARRTAQISDTAPAGYTARARGTLEFLAQLGDTALIPPKIVRSSELAVNLYWTAPNISRQVVVGLRDTSVVPIDIGFYRDRYGVLQSNFPDRIRLGDGRDVADVIHPFSPAGLQSYDFALLDSLSITTGGQRLLLQEVAFRPRDPRAPLAIGSAYIARGTSDIVRLALTFTRSALLDQRIEALSVVLENELVEGRFWLPRRQELEVQRGGTLFDFPARGIVRARWNICCYDIRVAAAAVARSLGGSGITFRPPAELKAFAFDDSLFGDMRVGSAALHPSDIARVQALARQVVARRMLEKPAGAMFAAAKISDLLRFDRAEGFAAGGGGALRLGGGSELGARARYGVADAKGKGEVFVSIRVNDDHVVRLFAERDYRDVSDVPERSGALNSLGAQEFASDYTDPFDVRGAGLEISLGRVASLHWRLEGEVESQRALTVRAQPVSGTFAPLIDAAAVHGTRLSLVADGGMWHPRAAATLSADGELRLGQFYGSSDSTAMTQFGRAFVQTRLATPMANGVFVGQTLAAVNVWRGSLPAQQLVYFGGPVTGPGYDYHQFAGRAAVSQRLEWQHAISLAPLPIGSLGNVPSLTNAMIYLHAVGVAPVIGASAIYPAVGAATELFSGLIRIDVARGLRNRGGRWTLEIDAGRGYWSIL